MIVHQPVLFSPPVPSYVGQAEVVRELVREHADAAVLGLDRVVADPVVAAADADATEPLGAKPSGPSAPTGMLLTYERWLQMAFSPWAPPPVSSPSPA